MVTFFLESKERKTIYFTVHEKTVSLMFPKHSSFLAFQHISIRSLFYTTDFTSYIDNSTLCYTWENTKKLQTNLKFKQRIFSSDFRMIKWNQSNLLPLLLNSFNYKENCQQTYVRSSCSCWIHVTVL